MEVEVSVTEIELGCTYAVTGGELAVPTREWTAEDGAPWIEATFTTSGEDDRTEQYPRSKFLELIRQQMFVETYRDTDKQ
jgi:hypothetical protein